MPVERVIIKADEFRTKDTAGNTTFWSGNQYLKTQVNGQFSVGGFQRAPVIVGYGNGNINDKTQFGGYYRLLQSGSPRYTDQPTMTWNWIFDIGADIQYSHQLPGFPMSNDYPDVYSGVLYYSYNGIPNYGTHRFQSTVVGRPLAGGEVRPIGSFTRVIDFVPVGPGTYVFSTPAQGNSWLSTVAFMTKSPVNIELAVTP